MRAIFVYSCICLYTTLSPFVHAQSAATTRTTGLPDTPPPERILDTADLLDADTAANLGDYLNLRFQRDGIRVYLVTYPSLPTGVYPAERAKQLAKLWLGKTSAPTTFGGVLVFSAASGKFGTSITSAASTEEGKSMIRRVVRNGESRVASYISNAEALHETTLDFDYSLRKVSDEARDARKVQISLLLGLGAIVAILLVVGFYFAMRRLRLSNFFGRSYVIPHKISTKRLGGSESGGHSAVLSWQEPEAQPANDQRP